MSPGTTDVQPPADADTAHCFDAEGFLAVERKRNPFMRSPRGGQILSALMLPYFTLLPPVGFGVLITTGRRTGKTRRRCIHAIRRGDVAYIVMIRPALTHKASAWMLNIRANPRVRLHMRGGTLAGVARELHAGPELEQARAAYCDTVNPFDYVECCFHRSGRPTREKIKELHLSWFQSGIPLVVELESQPD